MTKQANLFHTRGYQIEATDFTSMAVKQIVTGQPDDSHIIKIIVSNTDTIQHNFDLLVITALESKELFLNLVIPANTTVSLLESSILGLNDSNGNRYIPLPSTCNLLTNLKTSPTTGKKVTFVCTSEYF